MLSFASPALSSVSGSLARIKGPARIRLHQRRQIRAIRNVDFSFGKSAATARQYLLACVPFATFTREHHSRFPVTTTPRDHDHSADASEFARSIGRHACRRIGAGRSRSRPRRAFLTPANFASTCRALPEFGTLIASIEFVSALHIFTSCKNKFKADPHRLLLSLLFLLRAKNIFIFFSSPSLKSHLLYSKMHTTSVVAKTLFG